MSNLIAHWRSLQLKNRVGFSLSMIVLIGSVIMLAVQITRIVSDIIEAFQPAA
jgi:hypothetical protein